MGLRRVWTEEPSRGWLFIPGVDGGGFFGLKKNVIHPSKAGNAVRSGPGKGVAGAVAEHGGAKGRWRMEIFPELMSGRGRGRRGCTRARRRNQFCDLDAAMEGDDVGGDVLGFCEFGALEFGGEEFEVLRQASGMGLSSAMRLVSFS